MKVAIGALLLLLALPSGCAKKEAQAQAQSGTAQTPPPTAVRTDELVVRGNPSVRRPIVHLHGMCADPKEDLDAWGNIAKDHGTIIAVKGDVPCPDKPGRLKWSNDAAAIDSKIESTVKSV